MDVILLERIEKLGQMGDVVRVKPGYARNYLLPQKKALRANKANLAIFEAQRATLEARNLERKQEAQDVAGRMTDVTITVIRQAGEAGQLYGSVTARDVAETLTADGYSVDKRQVAVDPPIKSLGLEKVRITLHPDVSVIVTVNVARSVEEAQLQLERGGMVTGLDLDDDEDEFDGYDDDEPDDDGDTDAAADGDATEGETPAA